ncbi:K+-H+ exchange-like protein [Citrus sinensis]|nr:K+-H+ exchange-like protein [Citrus sinensis]
MRARLVVFPVKGRNWCFSRSIDPLSPETASSCNTPTTLKQLWHKLTSSEQHNSNNVELVVDFVSHKMNNAWIGLEKAPQGSMKNKIHGLGLKLLSGVKPSEMFLKSISKEVSQVEVTYPSRGTILHNKYLYGSVSLLPLTFVFSGSEKLLQLVSNDSHTQNFGFSNVKGSEAEHNNSEYETSNLQGVPSILVPSGELEELIHSGGKTDDGLSKCAILNICTIYKLSPIDVLKYRNSM